ncbi:hypothetical protein [Luedemannella helvata]|uniref:Uncharacterized protein n=1 Tax=Luedemannella helvata TaxID=349315 RepID=A0ABP4VZH9_9ACTN
MFSRRKEIIEQLAAISKALDLLDRRVEKMETVIIVREPSSAAAAEAYDGLRKQVVNAVSDRLNHLSQLVQLDVALNAGAGADQLAKLVDAWFEQAALLRVDDPRHPRRDTLFELVADHGGAYEVLEPAYVDIMTGRVIRLGRARRSPVADVSPTPDVQPEPADDRARHRDTTPAVTEGAPQGGVA